jgi:hypothetical protein
MLGIAAVFGTLLLGWPSVSENQQSTPHTVSHDPNNSARPIPPTHVVIDPPLPTAASKAEASNSQTQPPETPLPRFERPEWVIVYITAIYALIAWWTLRAIKRQADTMETQAKDARKSSSEAARVATETLEEMKLQRSQTVNAMNKQAYEISEQTSILASSVKAAQTSADAAKLSAESTLGQFQAMKAKERARVWIGIDGDLNLGMGPFAVPVAYVVTQTGPTDGFVYASFAKLVVSDVHPEVPLDSGIHSIGIPSRVAPQFEKKIGNPFLYSFSREEIESIEAKTASAYFMASINYWDIFGDPHETSIMKQWRITDHKNIGGYGNFAYWTSCGPPEANRET